MKQNLNYKSFKTGAVITMLSGIILLAASFSIGKIPLFLMLNTNLGTFADWFFHYYTNAGDGLVWIAVLLIVVFILKRKDLLPLLISSFILVTIFTQICKYIIVPDEPRPIKAIADTSLIHTVPGVELHTISSFPSGHTAAAFAFYLLFCLMLPQSWWLIAGLILALLVGYSRVYLAQHFPVDVGAGMVVAFLSVWLSLFVQAYFVKRRALKKAKAEI